MSSPVKLNTNTSPSMSIIGIQERVAQESVTGHAVGALLSLGVMFLGFTSLGGAFFPGCPFRSAFSGVIRFVFAKLQTLSKRILCGCHSSKWLRRLWIGTLTFLWVATNVAVTYATFISNTWLSWFSLFFFPAAIPIAYSAQQEAVHKPQKYKISHLALWVFLLVSLNDLTTCTPNTYTSIFCWSVGYRLRLLDD